ncbi:MAG: hypothetical protein IBX55_16660 [Methyloprofundus sp.]|nr:hypothetical protein [Methyloprofundus sp.]
MSISSVNPYMSMLAAYKAATADNKQSNTPLDTVESTQAKATTRPGEDTVSISQEALNQAKKEQSSEPDYPRPYSPMTSQQIFDKGMANLDENGNPVFGREKPIESILPENLKILEELKQVKPANKHEMIDREIDIGIIMVYGDKEVFSSTEEVRARHKAYIEASVFMHQEWATRDLHATKQNQGISPSVGVDSQSLENEDLAKSMLSENLKFLEQLNQAQVAKIEEFLGKGIEPSVFKMFANT